MHKTTWFEKAVQKKECQSVVKVGMSAVEIDVVIYRLTYALENCKQAPIVGVPQPAGIAEIFYVPKTLLIEILTQVVDLVDEVEKMEPSASTEHTADLKRCRADANPDLGDAWPSVA